MNLFFAKQTPENKIDRKIDYQTGTKLGYRTVSLELELTRRYTVNTAFWFEMFSK